MTTTIDTGPEFWASKGLTQPPTVTGEPGSFRDVFGPLSDDEAAQWATPSPKPPTPPAVVAGAPPGPPPQWWVDLGPYLRGERVATPPDVGLMRSGDGLRPFYSRKEHSVIGEMESGKTWLVAAAIADVLLNGGLVVKFHWEEPDPGDDIDRLLALGVSTEAIAERFRFVDPDVALDITRINEIATWGPRFVVHDGVNEAMSQWGWEIGKAEGVAAYRRVLVKPFTAAGAAVVGCDHVVKDPTQRGRSPFGSVHKGNGLTGSLILLENAEPFGRGRKGRSHVYVTKDRPGFLRKQGRPTKEPGKTFMGELVVDDTREYVSYLDLKWYAPSDEAQRPAEDMTGEGERQKVFDAVDALKAAGIPANKGKVRARAGQGHAATEHAIDYLLAFGGLVETAGPRGAKVLDRPATPPQDRDSE